MNERFTRVSSTGGRLWEDKDSNLQNKEIFIRRKQLRPNW